MNKTVKIFDTTLRDGEQSPGASMNAKEKMLVAKQLERLGVDTIEAGFAASSPGDFESVQQIGHALKGPMVVSLCRAHDRDIDQGCEALKGSYNWGIHTFIATSDLHLEAKLKMDYNTAIQTAVRAVERAKMHTDNVEFSAEDATRSNPDFLVEIFSAAVKAGATTLNIPDTVGYITPQEMFQLVERMRNEVYNADQVIFSVHCHNDLGLATANSLAAIEAGARQVECTINGIGERAGNAAMEELVMTLKTRKSYYDLNTNINTKEIMHSSRLLSQITGITIQPNKAIVGANAFAHEAGIHQDGIIKNRLTYEIMNPEQIGLSTINTFVLGKHSGRNALQQKIIELGYDVSDEELQRIFTEFKILADKKKELYDKDIESLITKGKTQVEEQYQIEDFKTSSSSEAQAKADITLKINNQSLISKSAEGDGPIDAALNAIKKALGISCKLISYNVAALTVGTDAQGEITIGIEIDGEKYFGKAIHTDVVYGSALAFINALNRKVYQSI